VVKTVSCGVRCRRSFEFRQPLPFPAAEFVPKGIPSAAYNYRPEPSWATSNYKICPEKKEKKEM